MNNLIYKKHLVPVLVGVGIMFSFSANAQDSSLESAISNVIVAQGQQVIKDMSVQIQHSIIQDAKRFNFDGALNWLAVNEQPENHQAKTETKNLHNQTIKTSEDE